MLAPTAAVRKFGKMLPRWYTISVGKIMKKIIKTDEEWRKTLSKDQYRVMRQKGTEPPFSGAYVTQKKPGIYHCSACGTPLFSSSTKFDSGSGWPSFWEVVDSGHVKLQKDLSHGMVRTESVCAACGSHLGHLFDDGPPEKGGQRYCINSCALQFSAEKEG